MIVAFTAKISKTVAVCIGTECLGYAVDKNNVLQFNQVLEEYLCLICQTMKGVFKSWQRQLAFEYGMKKVISSSTSVANA